MAGGAGSEDGDIGFQIAPMVDVVFVLMLFFMASAGAQVVEKELTINLPSGPAKARSANVFKTPIIIEISAEGQVSMNQTPYGTTTDKELRPLREWLVNALAQFGAEDPIIIRPNQDTRHERVMDVLNAISGSRVKEGNSEITFKNLTFG